MRITNYPKQEVGTTRKIKFLKWTISVEWPLLAVILVAGILLRLEAHEHLTTISPDGIAYVYGSMQVLQGIGEFERRGPLFQGLLLISHMALDVGFQSSVLIPQLFGSVIPILLFLVGKRFFDPETGLFAALLGTLNPLLTNLSSWVLRETLSAALVLALVLAVHYTIKIRSPGKSLFLTVLPGIISGLIILTREEMLFVIPPAYAAYVILRERKPKISLARISIFLVTTILVMAPWLLYSLSHFEDPFFSYTYYIDPKYISEASGGESVSAAKAPAVLRILSAFFSGVWKVAIESPAVFSLFGLAFLPIGILFTFRNRNIWLIYIVAALDFALVSFFASMPWYFTVPAKTFDWSDPTRFFFSTAMVLNVIIAFGARRVLSLLAESRSKPLFSEPNQPSSKKRKRRKKWFVVRYPKVSLLWLFALLALLMLGIASYLPAYVQTFEQFDARSAIPFVEASRFLNANGNSSGVFTAHPDLLARYYSGPVYKLPEKGGFEDILQEASRKGVQYILIESTCVTSPELVRLYYKSAYPASTWTRIPSEFVLVQRKGGAALYGLFFIQTELWFKSAIYGTGAWDSTTSWEQMIPLIGGETTSFDDTTIISSADLSNYDLVVFADFLRPLGDQERTAIETAVQSGLTVIVSGLSPYHLAGGATNLTRISPWFGATKFSEAPREQRWATKFTENATQIMQELDLDREYAFYTASDWSTPAGVLAEPESTVYAYREEDQLATILTHDYGEGTSIFVGSRFGFESSDAGIFRTFLMYLITSRM
ncbi:MAG: glycosyltransferase family 39 protein [Candidatus Bathyarchaeota archaeon]|nr:MAG: glycosyltransferase family 39 protein [Candidatus Bathyarchaeota archaeon]